GAIAGNRYLNAAVFHRLSTTCQQFAHRMNVMTWIAFLLAVFFSASAVFVLAVLLSSYRSAFAAYRDIRLALDCCEVERVFTIRTSEHRFDWRAPTQGPKLRLASSTALPVPSYPLRAAA